MNVFSSDHLPYDVLTVAPTLALGMPQQDAPLPGGVVFLVVGFVQRTSALTWRADH